MAIFRRKVAMVFMCAQLGCLVALGIRGLVPSWHRWLHGSDIGSWSMYPHRLDSRLTAEAREESGETVKLKPGELLWHNTLGSSAHPRVEEEVLEALAKHLADRFEPPHAGHWRVVVELARVVNGKLAETLRGECEVPQ
jgi:hypothetical protein